jgi:hypothetical protein
MQDVKWNRSLAVDPLRTIQNNMLTLLSGKKIRITKKVGKCLIMGTKMQENC